MTNKQDRPALGQRVTWTAQLVRKREPKTNRKFWERVPCEEKRGLYNGYRYLQNGKMIEHHSVSEEWGDEWEEYFKPDEHVLAYHLVENERTNYVNVLPEDCQWEPKTDLMIYRDALRLVMCGLRTGMDGNKTCIFCDYNQQEKTPHANYCEWQIAAQAINAVEGEVGDD